MNVVGYIRVLTQKPKDQNVSIESQRSSIEGFAEAYGLTLAAVLVDLGESAKTLDRPGLQRVLRMLESGEADGVVVSQMDRLSQSISDWGILLRGYFGEQGGKRLFAVLEMFRSAKAVVTPPADLRPHTERTGKMNPLVPHLFRHRKPNVWSRLLTDSD